MKRLAIEIGFALALVIGSAVEARADIVQVQVFDFEFSANPPGQPIVDPVINVGDTVRWIWVSGLHSTTSVEGLSESWASDLTTPPFSFDHTFTHTGEFEYFCLIHGFDNGDGTAGGMSGVITVVPEPATIALGSACILSFVFSRCRRR